jgi:flagellin
MPLVVNTNISSLNAQRLLTQNTSMLQKSMEKLSSGFRINRSADDAAGLQLSETLRAQIRGSQKALDNTQDGINVLNLTDGALQQVTDNLQRMRELSVQAANDTYSTNQRNAIDSEMFQLSSDITRIAQATQFNGIALLDGTNAAAGTINLQIGPNDNSAGNDQLDISTAFGDVTAATLGIDVAAANAGGGGVDILTDNTSRSAAIATIDAAIDSVNTQRGTIGAFVNRLEGAANNLSNAIENFSSSESRIRNVDVALESANLTRNQILQQASATMLAQANSAPQLALKLLQG